MLRGGLGVSEVPTWGSEVFALGLRGVTVEPVGAADVQVGVGVEEFGAVVAFHERSFWVRESFSFKPHPRLVTLAVEFS